MSLAHTYLHTPAHTRCGSRSFQPSTKSPPWPFPLPPPHTHTTHDHGPSPLKRIACTQSSGFDGNLGEKGHQAAGEVNPKATDSDATLIGNIFCFGVGSPNYLSSNGGVSVRIQGSHRHASPPTVTINASSNMGELKNMIESKTGAECLFYDRTNKSVPLSGASIPPHYVLVVLKGALSGGMLSATPAANASSDPRVSHE